MHDGLGVPASKAGIARDFMASAFSTILHVSWEPHIKVRYRPLSEDALAAAANF